MAAVRRIAIDVMGGDHGAVVTMPACLEAVSRHPDLQLFLFGNQELIQPYLSSARPARNSGLTLKHSESQVFNEDNPVAALRSGRDSSMFKAVEMLEKGEADAVVSAGNTGALLLIGRHLLKTLPGVSKPAIMATLPGTDKQCFLLDVGANPNCDASMNHKRSMHYH